MLNIQLLCWINHYLTNLCINSVKRPILELSGDSMLISRFHVPINTLLTFTRDQYLVISFKKSPLPFRMPIFHVIPKSASCLFAKYGQIALCKNCPYSELFRFVFSRILTEYEPEQLRIRTLFTQCRLTFNFLLPVGLDIHH